MRLPAKGRWRFAVRAQNAVGYGPLSARSNIVRPVREATPGPGGVCQLAAPASAPRRQRMPASRKPSRSPSKTAEGLPDS